MDQARSGDAARTWLSEKLRAPRFRLEAVEFLGLEKLAPMKLLKRAGLGSRVPLIDLDLDVLIGKLSSHPRVASCVASSNTSPWLSLAICRKRG